MAFKINIVVRLQHWMDSVPGQTFLNYAYSWGASIVILGALFKLTHLPGGNFMLFIGMGTEVIVFFLSAFDRPFDKDEIGKDLPHDYETDEEIAAHYELDEEDDDEELDDETADTETVEGKQPAKKHKGRHHHGAQPAGQPSIVFCQPGVPAGMTAAAGVAAGAPVQSAGDDSVQAAAQAAIQAHTPAGAVPFENEAQRLAEVIRLANDELLQRAQAVLSPEMETATQEYIQKLRALGETFAKVDEQSLRLTRDSEEMANLGRTLTAINKTYDLHFKSISQQVGTIEQINEQTRSLARRIEELNGVYSRMIQAMTINMNMQQPGNAYQQPANNQQPMPGYPGQNMPQP